MPVCSSFGVGAFLMVLRCCVVWLVDASGRIRRVWGWAARCSGASWGILAREVCRQMVSAAVSLDSWVLGRV